MWIRARSSATSKRSKVRPFVHLFARCAAALLTAITLFAGGCIVTDKIEFDDRVNMPAEVLLTSPDNTVIVTACSGAEFTAYLWEPDVQDLETFEAQIRVRINPYAESSVPSTCLVEESDREWSGYEGGIFLRVDCPFSLADFVTNLGDITQVTATVTTADFGFDAANAPSAGSRTTDILWLVDLLDCES